MFRFLGNLQEAAVPQISITSIFYILLLYISDAGILATFPQIYMCGTDVFVAPFCLFGVHLCLTQSLAK